MIVTFFERVKVLHMPTLAMVCLCAIQGSAKSWQARLNAKMIKDRPFLNWERQFMAPHEYVIARYARLLCKTPIMFFVACWKTRALVILIASQQIVRNFPKTALLTKNVFCIFDERLSSFKSVLITSISIASFLMYVLNLFSCWGIFFSYPLSKS